MRFDTDKDQVLIVWEDGHKTSFDVTFLRDHAYALNRKEIVPPPNDVSLIQIDFNHFLEKYPLDAGGKIEISRALSDEGMRAYRMACGERLRKYGAVVVINRGLNTEEIINDFLPPGKEVVATHFGRIEDLRTDNTTNKKFGHKK